MCVAGIRPVLLSWPARQYILCTSEWIWYVRTIFISIYPPGRSSGHSKATTNLYKNVYKIHYIYIRFILMLCISVSVCSTWGTPRIILALCICALCLCMIFLHTFYNNNKNMIEIEAIVRTWFIAFDRLYFNYCGIWRMILSLSLSRSLFPFLLPSTNAHFVCCSLCVPEWVRHHLSGAVIYRDYFLVVGWIGVARSE